MYKKRCGQFLVVFTILLIVLSPLVLATSCTEDSDCSDLGEDWACDTSISECVELDFDFETTSSEDSSTTESENTTTENSTETIVDENTTVTETSTDTSELESRVSTIETNIETINSQIEELSETVYEINTNVQSLSTDQYQLEREVEEQVTQVSSGLAVLQEDVESTKSELEGTKEVAAASEAKATFFRNISLAAIIIFVFLAIGYFLQMHKKEEAKELPEDIRQYITGQIKKGVNQVGIIEALKKSGWPEHDAKWAFEQTTVKNYNDFLELQGKETKEIPKHKVSNNNYKKIAVVSILSIVLLAVMLFYVKQSVGFATYYQGINDEDLASLVEDQLESKVDQNSFYALIDYLDLCVQVNDGDASSSFRVLKTPYGHSVTPLDESCTATSSDYDFAVSFSSWNDFYTLSSTMTCDAFESVHSVSSGSTLARGMYILPSYYVEEGFSKVEGRSYSDFCSALSLCLSSSDLALLDIGC